MPSVPQLYDVNATGMNAAVRRRFADSICAAENRVRNGLRAQRTQLFVA
jgi:hypothetical protein